MGVISTPDITPIGAEVGVGPQTENFAKFLPRVQRVSGPEIVIVKGNAFCDMFFCRHIRQLLLILLFCGYCTVNVNFLVNHSMVQKESQFISEVQSTSEQ